MEERRARGPAGGDIGEDRRRAADPCGALPAMRAAIRLDEARLRLIPAHEGADREPPPA